ncbi:hypothetical protein I7I51_07448 [Histoplasma capsulatum]|uniref:Uncharacterized protein n=1 Tax=Ajellomyces capsulatus TaxID=5037 RepID=A0A8A1LVT2_AJECA|nr:hypothetical protein I7I51_07448 [Histoplasma capsulatum]
MVDTLPSRIEVGGLRLNSTHSEFGNVLVRGHAPKFASDLSSSQTLRTSSTQRSTSPAVSRTSLAQKLIRARIDMLQAENTANESYLFSPVTRVERRADQLTL